MSDEKIEQKKSNLLDKAMSFGKSVASRGISNKKASEETINLRRMSCHGDNNSKLPPCSERKDSVKYPGSFYCGACGCGDKAHTQLINTLDSEGKEKYSKLDYPKVTCPLKMPGFTNYKETEEGVSENPRKMYIEMTIGSVKIKELSR